MLKKTYSGDSGNTPDDTDDAPRAAFTPRARRGAVKARAEQLSELAFNDPNDWERFVDEATGQRKGTKKKSSRTKATSALPNMTTPTAPGARCCLKSSAMSTNTTAS
jgi:hypothetical protein